MKTSKAPFFVIGSPRSGTTLLRLLLTAHPRLVVPPECGFVVWLQPSFGHWGDKEFSDRRKVEHFSEAVYQARKFETWGISRRKIEEAILDSSDLDYGKACEIIYELYAEKQGKKEIVWGDKNNFYLHHVKDLKEIYPAARFIHIVRDGRDVACSYREVMSAGSQGKYHPRFPSDIDEIASIWSGDVEEVSSAFESLKEADKYELHYEDLTSAPEREMTALCNWLGVDYSEKMLEFHVYNRSLGLEPQETMIWKHKTLFPVDNASVGRYRQFLSEKEIGAFNRIAGRQLSKFGYEL